MLSASLKADGTLVVGGGNGDNSIVLAMNGTRPTSPVRVTVNGQVQLFTRSHVHRISIYSGDGNDAVRIDETNGIIPVSRYAYLGAGNDRYAGGAGRDLVQGGSQKDTLDGAGGNDWLNGQSGADSITGGAGADLLYGGTHDNFIVGGSGNDSIYGGPASDDLLGGPGVDEIVGFAGLDRISPSDGSDIPSVPTRLTARAISGTEARIDWLPTDDGSARFSLDYSTDGGYRFTHAATTRIGDSAIYINRLRPGTSYTIRLSAQSSDGALAAAPYDGAQTMEEDTSGWYRITNLGSMTKVEAVYTGDDDLSITDAQDPDGESPWIYAGSWQGAVYSGIDGTVTINDTNHTYTFPGDGEFLVDTAKNLRDTIDGNDLPDNADLKVIAIEDSYETTDVDRDYDDFYWPVDVEYRPSVSISTFNAEVTENTPGEKLTFRVSRSGATAGNLDVNLSDPSGSATEGTDYTAIPRTVTIPDGQDHVDFDVNAIDDPDAEGDEDVFVSLADPGADGAYMLAAPPSPPPTTGEATAKGTIHDDVNVKSIKVSKYPAPPDDPEFNAYSGFHYEVAITVEGESLSLADIEQWFDNTTKMTGFDGSQWTNFQIGTYFGGDEAIFNGHTRDWSKALANFIDPASHDGKAVLHDDHLFRLETYQIGSTQDRYAQLASHHRQLTTTVYDNFNNSIAEVVWGFSWDNDVNAWNTGDSPAPPYFYQAVSYKNNGLGDITFDNIEGA